MPTTRDPQKCRQLGQCNRHPAPALNPVRTLSLISLTRTLSLHAQAIRQITPTPIAAPVAILLPRDIVAGHISDCCGDNQRDC